MQWNGFIGNKIRRCFFTGILCAAFFLTGCSGGAGPQGSAKDKNKPDFSDIAAGDTVEFGTYEQDGRSLNGAEPITWEVLEVSDGQAVLISVYCLDIMPLHDQQAEVTWEDCTLRKWLNDGFLNTAFTEQEQGLLVEKELGNGEGPTVDKVFLLSLEELNFYYGEGYQDKMESRAPMTKYVAAKYPWDAFAKNFKDRPEEGNTITWWLRTPGKDKKCFEVVDGNRQVYSQGQTVVEKNLTGVRPVIVVEME